jgi:hypothetical protein
MNDYSHLCKWVDDQWAVEAIMGELPFPIFADVYGDIKESGKGKIQLLFKIVEGVAGKFPLRHQRIGDCVSMATAMSVDVAKSVDIEIHKDFESWIAETATEDIYAGARVDIGKGRIRGDGAVGAWAARYVNEYGALPRGKYGNVDLTTYSGDKARSWGRAGSGVPKTLIPVAKQHPILTVSRVDTYEQCRDLIYNGYGVFVCSGQGFSYTRDSEGFARPEGSWSHAMAIVGVDDSYKRKGVLIANSWGVFNKGPKRHNQPDGTFWVDADVLERRMLSRGDSWALSGYEGFKPQKLNTRIF